MFADDDGKSDKTNNTENNISNSQCYEIQEPELGLELGQEQSDEEEDATIGSRRAAGKASMAPSFAKHMEDLLMPGIQQELYESSDNLSERDYNAKVSSMLYEYQAFGESFC